MDVEEIVGAADIARRLGVSGPHVVHEWRRRHPDFPPPAATVNGRIALWEWPEVRRWAETTGRLQPGRER